MKTTIAVFTLLIMLTACKNNDSKSIDKKKEELASLKAEAKKISDKIKTLEAEIDLKDTSKKIDKSAKVVTSPVEAKIFKTYIQVQGRIDADQNVSLSTQIPGLITKINVVTGQQVSKGQVLAETDASSINQQIYDLQTSLDLAKQLFAKQQNLWNQKIGTEIQYLQAKNTKESLENKMSLLREQVRMSKIISPISGTVDAINIKLAQQVMPGMNAINVVNFSNLKVKAELAESYASRVKTGDRVEVFFPDLNDSFVTKVNFTSSTINVLSRTFTVEVMLNNNKKYHPNMVARLKINDFSSDKPVIAIQNKFIQKGLNENFVLVNENGFAVKKVIKIGREYSGMAEITEGLKTGDNLIIEGYDLINEGDKINTGS